LQIIGPAALIAAVAIETIARLPGLIADYRLLPDIEAARALTWQSGHDPATATPRYVVGPQGLVLLGLIPSLPGSFVAGAPDTAWWMTGLMHFFHKQRLEFAPPPPDASGRWGLRRGGQPSVAAGDRGPAANQV